VLGARARIGRRTPALIVANGLSAAIQGQFMFVLPWMLLAEGSSPATAALVAGLVFVPMLALTVPAGVVSDRAEPVRLMATALAAGLAASALYPLSALLGGERIGLAVLAALATGALRLFVEGAVLREVGDSATAAGMLRRQAIRSTLNQAALFASPFLGLLAFRLGGGVAVMLLVCALHVLALGVVGLASRAGDRPPPRPRTTAGAGFATLRGNARLQWIGAATLVWSVCSGAALGIMPAVLREHAGLDELEASAAFVLAGVVVVVLTLPVVRRLQRRLDAAATFLVAVAAEGVAVLLFAEPGPVLAATLAYALFLLAHSIAAATLSGARALEVDTAHQALLNLSLIAVALVGYLAGVGLTAGLIEPLGFGAVLLLIASGMVATAAGFRRPLLA
jgi:hypothetical protein